MRLWCAMTSARIRDMVSGEVMHPVDDPAVEARCLYVEQSRLTERLQLADSRPLVIWDVGLGAAANAMATIHAVESMPRRSCNACSWLVLRMTSIHCDWHCAIPSGSSICAMRRPTSCCSTIVGKAHPAALNGCWCTGTSCSASTRRPSLTWCSSIPSHTRPTAPCGLCRRFANWDRFAGTRPQNCSPTLTQPGCVRHCWPPDFSWPRAAPPVQNLKPRLPCHPWPQPCRMHVNYWALNGWKMATQWRTGAHWCRCGRGVA